MRVLDTQKGTGAVTRVLIDSADGERTDIREHVLNAPKMFGHTFRGSTVKNFLGLEDEREAFERYRKIRKAERAYI